MKHSDNISMEEFKKLVKTYLDIELSLESQERFSRYLNELSSWNKKINLISRKKDKPEDIYRHFLDSLLIFKAFKIPSGSKILDLGSGAGFPAIPMKILREDLDITLVESIRKKTLFLKKMIELLGLKDITVFQERIENLPELQGFNDGFDFVTAKAFGKLKYTIPASYPFLKPGGVLVAYKGRSYKTEIIDFLKQNENLKLQIKGIKYFEIPEISLKRFFVLIEKIS
ncbi:MAG: 16S rRNA (guanine(527)-N(7))-methyltransferase RsmG [candidate division Zixibacteria bacterium]|nr:16S rRNA (guanine(527)-N(7))-methyltransferase RsmG [candidate division Zixibacteria bacterium]